MESIKLQTPLKTYVNTRKIAPKKTPKPIRTDTEPQLLKREPLTTKKAVEFLLAGTLKYKVCRYCLHTAFPLMELDQYMQIAGRGALYSITIRDIIATVHPFKVIDDPNFPNKICNKCLNNAIRSYLFAQQCEQAERALRNCFDDMFEKLEKLDPIERTKKRGRQKLNPNHNVLYTEHRKVMDYAEPIRNLINSGSVSFTKETEMSNLECKKCWQVLPNIESLVNHEKIHPKSMWYHCRVCGKSFAKRNQINKHLRTHEKSKQIAVPENSFECKQCNYISENYNEHLQHIEKHKFQMVLEHLVERNMDKLCSVCFDKGKLEDLDKMVCLHGGYPELTGSRTLYNILGSTVPEMNILHNYTGTKICESCLNNAITSYVFINRIHYIRNRLDRCVSNMLENLNQIQPENKIFIEIHQNGIMPLEDDYIHDILHDENDDIDENKLKVDVLEDEFRIKSDSEESDEETEPSKTKVSENKDIPTKNNVNIDLKEDKVNTNVKLMNGYQPYHSKVEDVCSEFLTFNKKRKQTKKVYKCKFMCPLCSKHFISEYFLKRHVLKHVNVKVQCRMCCGKFKSKFYLREHMKMKHSTNVNNYESCKICGRVFKSEQKMLLHQKSHVNKECQLCSKMFRTQKHFDCHMERHAVKFNISKKESVQTCSFCEKECSDDNELGVHVNKVHLQIKPYGCDMCEKQFYTEMNLNSHKKIHSQFSKEKCEICSKILRSRKDLVIHVRKHIGIKPFRCHVCPQTFYSESNMKSHMRKWHGGSFCCRLCKKVFENLTGLKNHVNNGHSVF